MESTETFILWSNILKFLIRIFFFIFHCLYCENDETRAFFYFYTERDTGDRFL